MAVAAKNETDAWRGGLWRCVACGGPAEMDDAADALRCPSCGASYPVADDVLVVRDRVDANNEVARAFYDGPLWPKFRFWEWYTFLCNGGERRSRNKVLRHLPAGEGLKLLDVAVGDGVYLPWLPASWSVVGIDVSKVQLANCRKRAEGRDVRLVLGEAEDLPVRDGAFDACLSIGAFNYFNDPEKALREMARAVKPGGTIVISDEIPNLTDRLWFHKIGLPGLDRYFERLVTKNLGPEFTEMVERHKALDVPAIGRKVLADFRYELIWMKMGYVMHGTVPR
ncbi:class I SAM-dependent methyltransferase [Planctomyces sp. SH-PL62]|uniref:class I SAM-dependent methyltransferase n=1 Tax=Planctomyces sp. SH-PL62 TaxID=1636152 RepID=UPI00078D5023|nr:Demethylrebeccamycin-D-glucose O-methyltransferase [Planctomyces sp. SH-PL62]